MQAAERSSLGIRTASVPRRVDAAAEGAVSSAEEQQLRLRQQHYWNVLREPPRRCFLQLGRKLPSRHDLRKTLSELRWCCPELRAADPDAFEEPWVWAQRESGAGKLGDLTIEEAAALRLCSAGRMDCFGPMGRALSQEDASAAAASGSRSGWSGRGDAQQAENKLWEEFLLELCGGMQRLPRRGKEGVQRLFATVKLPRSTWNSHFEGRSGDAISFAAPILASEFEPVSVSKADNAPEGQDAVECVLEFDATVASQASNVHAFVDEVAGEPGSRREECWLLPPFVRGFIESVEVGARTKSWEQAGMLWQASCPRRAHVLIRGLRTVEPLAAVLEAPDEAILAGSLLVGLHAPDALPPSAGPTMLACAVGCFRALAAAAAVKNPDAVQTMWKGYLECLLEGIQTLKHFKDPNMGIVGVARTAVLDVAVAATGVTKRALGCDCCVNHSAMEAERNRRQQEAEDLKRDAVSVARAHLAALQLETLTDPEAFLRFLQHDPIKAFEAVPAVVQAYLEAEPAQRVLLFAKLMGLAAMAGGLLRGDPKVQSAFDSPFPVQEDVDLADMMERLEATTNESSLSPPADHDTSALHAVSLLRLQRLRLARTRLLIAGGAPDVGKTTLLREAFGFSHFVAGLSRTGQTEQITFALHPDGDDRFRPVYVVDTPGFGDGEKMHRNDMVRLLLGAGSWLPGGVTLLWVVKAGRQVRLEANDILRRMAADPRVSTLVVVTHIDIFFEERYREVGPQWRDSVLQGVPHKDPRWAAQRRKLMEELRTEVEEGVASILGRCPVRGRNPTGAGGLAFACLGGWMSVDEDDAEDEFAQAAPWPWARQELTEFFDVLNRQELRSWLDARLGI